MVDRGRVIAWADAGQEALVAEVARAAGVAVVAVGSPRAAQAAALSDRLGVEPAGDLRQALQREDADCLWLATACPLEPEERRIIREHPIAAVSSEPRPTAVGDLRVNRDEAATATFVPLLRSSPGYRAALDALEEFGPPRSVNLAAGSRTGEGSLFARLFDAMDAVHVLCGPGEGVSAALSGPRGRGGRVPETLGGLHGHLTAHVRCAEHRSACLSVSDTAGAWFRRLTIVGDGRALLVTDGGYEESGGETDSVPGGARAGGVGPLSTGALIGMQIIRVLAHIDRATDPPPDTATVLALCEAARLSCRTGQEEAPGRLLQARY